MSEHPIEGLMTTAMNSIQDMIDVNTIIGEPIETSNNVLTYSSPFSTISPISISLVTIILAPFYFLY